MYISPLQIAFSECSSLKTREIMPKLNYNGRLHELLDPNNFNTPLLMALNSPRILRGVIDLREDFKLEAIDSNFVCNISQAVLNLFSGQDSIITVNSIRAYFERSGLTNYLNERVYEEFDMVSWDTCDGNLMTEKVNELTSRLRNMTFMFLPLAHGALRPGIDFYLRLQDTLNPSDSYFYPIRFSHQKKGHSQPIVSREELSHLIRVSQKVDRVIIFDEDVDTGSTLTRARNWAKSHFGDEKIITANII